MSESFTKEELKPCPFCGDKVRPIGALDTSGCRTRDCLGNLGVIVRTERWNRRAALGAEQDQQVSRCDFDFYECRGLKAQATAASGDSPTPFRNKEKV